MEREDRRTLEAGGWGGIAASFGAAIFDLPTLLPGGALVRGATTGATVARTALSTGAAGALAAGVSETALQATQQTRPMSESAMAVGAGAVLGGLLGAGAGALFSKAERAAALQAVERARAEPDITDEAMSGIREGMREGQSAGAAAVDRVNLEDFAIEGGAAKVAGKAMAKVSPILRAAQSPSKAHRSVMADITETGFYIEKNTRGEGNIAVESAVKYWDRGVLTKGLEEQNQIYRDARKTGLNMSPTAFREEVSRAMRRGDVGPNDAVSKAASAWRRNLFEPLKQAAIEVGLLPPDVDVKTAVSYLTRIWNSRKLNAQEDRFREVVRPWLSDQIDQIQFKADEIRIGNRIVDADKQREALDRVTGRLDNLEERLAERAAIRGRKVGSLEGMRRQRASALTERAPQQLVAALRNLDETQGMVQAVKDARAAARSANRKRPFSERSPVLSIIRAKGGVRIGSKLDRELRALDVTPKTNPGLFRKDSGIGDVDNFVKSEHDVLADLPEDGAGYADPISVMEAIRDELAGRPLRTADEAAAEEFAENIDRVASEWLESVGLDPNSTVRQVRDFIAGVRRAEQNVDGLDTRISRFEQELEDFDAITDKMAGERQITEAEAKPLREALDELESELDQVADLANASPRVSLVVDYATTKRDLFKAKLAQRPMRRRIDALKRMEAEGSATDEMIAELRAKEIELGRSDALIDGLKTKADKLEPMVPKVKQEIPEFISEADRADYVEGILDDIFSTLTGRASQGMPSYDMTIAARGPLKDRTFNIPDEVIEEFLEQDIELIARRYARVMAADVELARKFGSPTMKEQIEGIAADYASLREGVRASDLSPAKKESELQSLAAREKRDVEDVAAMRDVLRGQYKLDSQHTNFARVLNAAMAFNYIRILGGVWFSSLSDAYRPAMVNGLGRYMNEGIKPLITNFRAIKLSVQDAKIMGAVTERMLQSRLATMAELADPYAQNSPFERFLQNTTSVFSKLTLLPWWNDMQKSITSVLVQNRVLKNTLGDFDALDPREMKYMGFVGIDRFMAERIARQFQEFGQVEGNVHIPGVERWTDDGARRAFAAALNKDVDGTIVTKGMGDVPLFMNTPGGRALGQFKSFALASHQRMLMRGLQEGPGSVMTGFIGMATLGALVYALKQIESGREVSDNPGTWIAEGLDRSGVMSIGFEINNTWEKLGGTGVYTGMAALFPERSQAQPASRYATRNAFGAAMGPTFQLGTDLTTLLGLGAQASFGRADPTPGDVTTMFNMVPGKSLPYFRWLIEGGFGLQDNSAFRGFKPEMQDAVR
ncbi:MAG: hypothetical protein IBJ07_12255 [Rhizobiaceae bacterium]|nr:hypothetical protein [Rhizobiaceae bacterium]